MNPKENFSVFYEPIYLRTLYKRIHNDYVFKIVRDNLWAEINDYFSNTSDSINNEMDKHKLQRVLDIYHE